MEKINVKRNLEARLNMEKGRVKQVSETKRDEFNPQYKTVEDYLFSLKCRCSCYCGACKC